MGLSSGIFSWGYHLGCCDVGQTIRGVVILDIFYGVEGCHLGCYLGVKIWDVDMWDIEYLGICHLGCYLGVVIWDVVM